MYTGLQVKYLFFFSYFSETVIFSIILKNTPILQYQLSRKEVQWVSSIPCGWPDGQTWWS